MKYHRYVFDDNGFVGAFEEMYRAEESEGFDSWFQDDLTAWNKQIPLFMIRQYAFNTILDIGCGKGALTHLLKTANNHVVGVDISETAIKRAQQRFTNCKFLAMSAEDALHRWEHFDLVSITEVLSYIRHWRWVINQAANVADYLFIGLYLPPPPIHGFIQNFGELREAILKDFTIEHELLLDQQSYFVMAKAL